MKIAVLLASTLMLAACSRNPDPEYAAERDATVAAPAAVEAPVAPATPPATRAARLSDEEAMRQGREAAALLFAQDIDALWPRFDAAVQAQAGSADNFGTMVSQILAQIGAEANVVEEAVETSERHAALTIYRRRGHYLAIGQDADLVIAFNADGTIAGLNFQPAQ